MLLTRIPAAIIICSDAREGRFHPRLPPLDAVALSSGSKTYAYFTSHIANTCTHNYTHSKQSGLLAAQTFFTSETFMHDRFRWGPGAVQIFHWTLVSRCSRCRCAKRHSASLPDSEPHLFSHTLQVPALQIILPDCGSSSTRRSV